MKKLFLFMVTAFWISGIYAQNTTVIPLNNNKSQVLLSQQTQDGFKLQINIKDLQLIDVTTKGGNFSQLGIENFTKIFVEGEPNIPVYSNLIEIPQEATVEYQIISYDEQIINLADYGITNKIMPAQRSVFKSEDPDRIPFQFNQDLYNKNEFLNTALFKVEYAGMMRHTRLATIQVNPVQYNPVTNQLKIKNNLQIAVTFKGADHSKTTALKQKYASPYFTALQSSVMNNSGKALITATPVTFVIVSDPMFQTQLQPYVEWKKKKGFHVIEAYTNTIGTTTTAIKTYLQNLYTTPAAGVNPPSFVLFVGDVAQVPAWSGTAGSHVTDLYYCEYTGDKIPEVFYGRFSAQNTGQLQPQIDKSLQYEKYLMPDPTYLKRVLMVAGDDASHELTWGNGQINYGTSNYFNATNGIYSHTFLQPANNAAIHDSIIANVNNGVGYANYTAHCGPSGWSEPSFEISDLPNVTNANKYSLWVGNCCQSNMFNNSECFGEAVLRAANKGAIGYIGGSNNTTWDEDYWWGVGLTSSISANPTYAASGLGAYDRMFHTHSEPQSDWYITQAQMVVGGNLAVQASSSSSKTYYWEIYHLMGDPSIIPYMGIPAANTPTANPSIILLGMTSVSITTHPNAYVALSQNGTLIATAMADSTTGVAQLTFQANDLTVGNADLVITGQNIQPYIGTIMVSPADQAYVVLNEYGLNSAPHNGNDVAININLKNVANAGSGYNAVNVNAVLSSTSPYVTITDNTESFGTINAGDSVTKTACFAFSIAMNIPDQTTMPFTIVSTDANDSTWTSNFNVIGRAPILQIGNMTIANDPNTNNRLDPGETLDLIFAVNNVGGAAADAPYAFLTGNSPYLTINSDLVTVDPIAAAGTTNVTFNVTAHAATLQGTPVSLMMTAYEIDSVSKSEDLVIGVPPEKPIGNGTTQSDYYPFYNYYKCNKTQMIYLASEIGTGSQTIQKIAFDLAFATQNAAHRLLPNFTIKFKPVTASAFSGAFMDMTGATTVFSNASYTMPGTVGIHQFDITDYIFDGTTNLLIEVEWGQMANYCASGDQYKVKCTSTTGNTVAYGYQDTPPPTTYDGQTNMRPNIVLYMQADSGGTAYDVPFKVIDGSTQAAITTASVKVGSLQKNVNSNGVTIFNLIEGAYAYNASAPIYNPINNQSFTVANADTVVIQMSSAPLRAIDFNVVDSANGNPITGAIITINTNTQTTNSSGYAVFNLYDGNYTYTVTATDYRTKSAQINVTGNASQTVALVNNVGISKVASVAVNVYPNPAKEKLFVNATQHIQKISITGLDGKKVLEMNGTSNTAEINISNIENGSYLLYIHTAQGTAVKKITIIK